MSTPTPETLQTSVPIVRASLAASARPATWLRSLVAQNAEAAHEREGGLDISQPYQRGDVWTDDQRRLFIKSLLMGVPVPALIVNDRMGAGYRDPLGRPDWRYAIIDGKQRTITMLAWFDSTLAVPASWFDPALIETTTSTPDGDYVTYAGLTIIGQRHTHNDFILPVAQGRFTTLAAEAHIFTLVNRAGTPMTDEDLERAFILADAPEA